MHLRMPNFSEFIVILFYRLKNEAQIPGVLCFSNAINVEFEIHIKFHAAFSHCSPLFQFYIHFHASKFEFMIHLDFLQNFSA